MRKVFESNKLNTIGEAKMFYNEKLHDLHFQPKGDMEGARSMYGGEDR
jgi:hypothetical protein